MTSKVLHNFTLIDGTGRSPVSDAALVLEGERIQRVGPRDELTLSTEGAEWQDLGGCRVLPGLIDCHVHLACPGSPTSRLEGEWGYSAALMLRHACASLEAGFTALRDVGGRHHLEFGIRRALEEGHWSGPRLYLAGKVLSMTAAGAEYYDGMYREADGTDEVRKAAREQLKAGADLIKVMASGAVLTPGEEPGAPQYGLAEIQVAVEEAEKVNRSVAAHAHGAQAIRNAVEAGARTIEHGTYLEEDPELIDRMAEEGVMLVPTLKSLHDLLAHEHEGVPQWAVEKGLRNQEALARSVRQARERGVPIAMGTDAGTPYNYHGENGLELALMAEVGLSPMEAIVAATRHAAEALGEGDRMGTVEPGRLADLLVVRGDPLADVRILTQKDSIEAVFIGGQQVVPGL
jgi:imidazolonepropionase-like amidohydrolase